MKITSQILILPLLLSLVSCGGGGGDSAAADLTPDAFSFIDQTDIALSTPTESAAITVTGINNATAISITGGEYSIDSGTYTSATGTVSNGQGITVRHTSSADFVTTSDTTLTIGGVSDVFTTTTRAADTTPDSFVFTDQSGVTLNTLIESAAITVAGIESASAISITGGEYSIDSGAYTSATGTVSNGQNIKVRHTSSASFVTATDTTLTIGGISDTFSTTTVAEDLTPNTFSFIDQTDVALSTPTESAAITVTGINSASAISITGGEYSIEGGAYTSATGTVSNGQSITVRHTSSAGFVTATDTTLTIGGVSDVFTTTTRAADTTPDSFVFTDQSEVALNTLIESAAITVAGIESASAISITGGEYSIDSGAYTSATGTVSNGQNIKVRHTSSADFVTTTDTTLTIGGISDTFTTTTIAEDLTPDAFSFIDQTDVALSTLTESAAITVAGINSATAISITGGEYSIDSGAYTSAIGTVSNGQNITVRHTSSAGFVTATDTTLTIGGISDTFSTTTAAEDLTPDAFSFTDQTDVALSTLTESAAITVTGINNATAISITGGEYSINSGSYTSTTGTVSNGQIIKVRHTSSAGFVTATNTTLTIGGVSDLFTTTTVNIAAPADLAVVAGQYAGQASLSWSSVTDATEYSLYYATESFAGLGDVANYASLANGVMLASQTSPVTIRNLSNNTTYYFVVTSGNGSTESSASSEVSALVYAPLNDTGITLCGDYAYDGGSDLHQNNLDCVALGATTSADGADGDGDPVPAGQDAHFGRDVSANDDTDGHAGFFFTKLDSSGNALPATATSWSCVQDNVTGLIWEVKTTSGLQSSTNTYTWYNSTNSNDGGDHGIGDTGVGTTTGYETIIGTYTGSDNCADSARCDTEKYAADVNSAGLCGASDWRLPSKEELSSLVDSSVAYPGPTIDTDWFPNTVASLYWSASPYAEVSSGAWFVYFYGGYVVNNDKFNAFYVRLVRGGQ